MCSLHLHPIVSYGRDLSHSRCEYFFLSMVGFPSQPTSSERLLVEVGRFRERQLVEVGRDSYSGFWLAEVHEGEWYCPCHLVPFHSNDLIPGLLAVCSIPIQLSPTQPLFHFFNG